MKRTWIVYVEMGIGHELQNSIDDSDFFGPYTKSEADAIASRLNAIFDQEEEHHEHQVAKTMPLEHLSARELVRRYNVEPAEGV